MSLVNEIKLLIDRCTERQRREIFDYLRRFVPVHPIEAKLNAQAEVILEAIDRASDLTLRGIRGIIAEAAFAVDILSELEGWRDVTPPGDWPYDFLLEDTAGQIRVQVKMQRRVGGRPMMANEASRILSPEMFVVETQRTRGESTEQPVKIHGHIDSGSSTSSLFRGIRPRIVGTHSCTALATGFSRGKTIRRC